MDSRPSTYDIAFAGAHNVGKTTLFESLKQSRCNETIPDRTGRTVTRHIDKWTHRTACGPGGELKTVTLWDTGGMERSSVFSMTKSYFIQTIGFILVYDTGDISTLQELNNWFHRAEAESSAADKLVYSLWGNCTDNSKNIVSSDVVQADYAPTFKVPPNLDFKVNAKTGWNVEESYQKVLEAVHRAQTQGPSPVPSSTPAPQPPGFVTLFAKMAHEKFRQTVPTLPETVAPCHDPNLPSPSSDAEVHASTIVPREEDTREDEEMKSRKCWC